MVAGRELSPAAVEAVAKGQVWSGADALGHGLVDRLGGLQEAIIAVRERLKLPPDAPVELVPYPTDADSFEAYFDRFLGSESAGLRATLAGFTTALRELRNLAALGRMADGTPRLEAMPLEPAR